MKKYLKIALLTCGFWAYTCPDLYAETFSNCPSTIKCSSYDKPSESCKQPNRPDLKFIGNPYLTQLTLSKNEEHLTDNGTSASLFCTYEGGRATMRAKGIYDKFSKPVNWTPDPFDKYNYLCNATTCTFEGIARK